MIYYVVFNYFLHNPTPDFALFLFSGLLHGTCSTTRSCRPRVSRRARRHREEGRLPPRGACAGPGGDSHLLLLLPVLHSRHLSRRFSSHPELRICSPLCCSPSCATSCSRPHSPFSSLPSTCTSRRAAPRRGAARGLFFSPPIMYRYFAQLTTLLHDHTWFRYIYEANPLMSIVVSFQRCLFGNVVPPAGKVFDRRRSSSITCCQRGCGGTYWIGLACVFGRPSCSSSSPWSSSAVSRATSPRSCDGR